MDIKTISKTVIGTEILFSINNDVVGTVNELHFSDDEFKCDIKKEIKK